MTEDEIRGRHHQLDGHEFEQTLKVGDGQGSVVCCSPWDPKDLDTTEGLNNNMRNRRGDTDTEESTMKRRRQRSG